MTKNEVFKKNMDRLEKNVHFVIIMNFTKMISMPQILKNI